MPFSDPPLSEEDIPAGLWLCHMCQMLKKQQRTTLNPNKNTVNDDELMQNEMQRIKDSRPSTPITSDGVINAAKVRLNHKRSLSRVSSSSDNSLSSDRDIKTKITRKDSDQSSSNSNGVEIIVTIEENSAQSTENIDVRNDLKDIEQHKESNEAAQQPEQYQSVEYLIDETDVENHSEEKEDRKVNDLISSEDVIETKETHETNETKETDETKEINDTIENPLEETKKIEEQPFQETMEIDENPSEMANENNEIPSTEINENNEKPPEIVNVNQNEESLVETQPNMDDAEMANDNDEMQTNADNCEIINENEADQSETNDEKTTDFKSPFEELIRAASILNPRQFELPRELLICPQFPGDEKG